MLDSRQVHDGHTIDVAVKRYRRADGNEVTREVVEHPGSVAILAYDEESVYLVRQPREAVEADGLLEIPAGTLEPGEDELACARRELAEEVGLAAADWRLLKRVHTSPGVISEVATIFAATGLAEASGAGRRRADRGRAAAARRARGGAGGDHRRDHADRAAAIAARGPLKPSARSRRRSGGCRCRR